jgi:hypothetical protein
VESPGSPPAAAPVFAPDAVRRFRFTGWELDVPTGRIDLGYALEGPGVDERLHETVDLGRPLPTLPVERRAALERAIGLLHLVAGVSYYKTSFAPQVVLDRGPVDPVVADCLSHLYGEGLAECRYVNGLTGHGPPEFPVAASSAAPPAGLADRPLVPVGGGKDSIVTIEALRRRGRMPLLFSVGDAEAITRTVSLSGCEHAAVRRTLDPRLLELNRLGARNGHVPVTAVISCIAAVVALVEGAAEVVMSDERSASVGSLSWDGGEVNHQYSKSWDFEQRLDRALRHAVAPDLRYFSLLRPWSELAIARSFAKLTDYHHAFVSCNRAYLFDRDRRTARWCADCPKCRFVSLVLAPFLARDRVVSILGADMLGDAAQLPGFAALLGLDADKPLECVGEVEESRVAMHLVRASSGWEDAAVVRELSRHPAVRDLTPAVVRSVLAPAPVHGLPDRYRSLADALV